VTHPAIARLLLATLCGLQGLGTLAIDLGRAHATNPKWPRHARFHVVWQVAGTALLSLLALAILFAPGQPPQEHFYLAAMLASIPMLSFFLALIARRLYGGALSDPNGIPPLKISVFGSERHIDLSLAVEILAACGLIAIVELFRH
jgi:hypothetical protein